MTDELAFAGITPREVRHQKALENGRVKCGVCPLECELEDGATCFCRTRTNEGGRLVTRAFDNPCVARVDAIEKLPLLHYRPGTKALTVGIGGCNLRCLYCQNYKQTQVRPEKIKHLELDVSDVVDAARSRGLGTVALGYTEPIAFLEWATDLAAASKRAGLGVAVATAAYVNPEPLLELAEHTDAFAIALKGFDEEFYHRVLGVELAPVLDALTTLKRQTGCWIEVVNLVIPGHNDSVEEQERLVRWVRSELGEDVPLHFARFSPAYRMKHVPRTPVATLERACEAARAVGMRHAYVSNVSPHDGNHTRCSECRELLIERLGFKVRGNALRDGACPSCSTPVRGVWV